jgi:hypothetical protein
MTDRSALIHSPPALWIAGSQPEQFPQLTNNEDHRQQSIEATSIPLSFRVGSFQPSQSRPARSLSGITDKNYTDIEFDWLQYASARSLNSTEMSVLRSKRGCWTCRLRKKKCDESRPHCSTCDLLKIPCYGFDAKPDWMDNGEQEKAVANSLKQIVKYTSRRKATSQVSNGHNPVIQVAPRLSDVLEETSSSATPASDLGSLTEDGASPLQDTSTVRNLKFEPP